jgi:penicillin-binding protein A
LCYLALFAQLNRIQVFDAQALRDNPDNTRAVLANYSRPRGTVSTIDGEVVARTVEVDTSLQRQREYPEGELFAQVSGFFSLHFGTSGIERVYDEELAGQTPELELRSLADLFVERDRSGSVVSCRCAATCSASRATRWASARGRSWSSTCRTGESWPCGRGRPMTPTWSARPDLTSATLARDLYLLNPASPMLGRAYQERYFPGSSFKVLVAAAGLESGLVTTDEPSYDRQSWTPPLTTRAITNAGNASCGGSLAEILRVSCNTAFAEMGSMTLGPAAMTEGIEAFGFNDRPPIDLPGTRTLGVPHRLRRCRSPAPTWTRPIPTFPAPCSRTPRRWPRLRSASTTCRPHRCRWRWWPQAWPTTGWSWPHGWSTRCATPTAT